MPRGAKDTWRDRAPRRRSYVESFSCVAFHKLIMSGAHHIHCKRTIEREFFRKNWPAPSFFREYLLCANPVTRDSNNSSKNTIGYRRALFVAAGLFFSWKNPSCCFHSFRVYQWLACCTYNQPSSLKSRDFGIALQPATLLPREYTYSLLTAVWMKPTPALG